LNPHNNIQRIFWVFENRPMQCLMVCFFEFLTPFLLKGCNFFIFNPFLMVVSVLDVPKRGVQVLFNHRPVCPRRKN
jgi:hypothetical protein